MTPATARREAVLIIDDDPDFREITALVAKSQGLEALTAEDCRTGLALLQKECDRIVVVLLDYFMPGMEPLPCVNAIRRLNLGSVPVILCTAAVDAAARAQELGLQRWLAKPFRLEQLRRAIKEARTANTTADEKL